MPAELQSAIAYIQQAQAAAPGEPAPAVPPGLRAMAQRLFVAQLDGGEEVPPVETPARGLAALLLDPDRGDIVVALLHGVQNATAAHIHRAPGGQNGPVVVPLGTTPFSLNAGNLTPEEVIDLREGRLYVNVHSTAHTAGEIRGQLLRLGEVLYTAALSGSNEVPPRETPATGSVAVILDARGAEIRTEGTFADLTSPVTTAHLHLGRAGENGPIRFPLTIVGSTLTGVHPITAEDRAALDAGAVYANVHSTMFPGGEIRGQLGRR